LRVAKGLRTVQEAWISPPLWFEDVYRSHHAPRDGCFLD
jgi:hypothetical protein